jgi:epoxide hydrolase 4
VEHKYADVNGVRLHYVTEGHGNVMLFVHGFPEFWYSWRHQLKEFAKTHQVVAPDMRGYNLSDKPEAVDAYKLDVLVQDVVALADHIGAKKFTLVGHDWGGIIAWAVAARFPERVKNLIIFNAPHPTVFARELTHNQAQIDASQYMLLFRTPEVAEAMVTDNNYAWLDQVAMLPGIAAGYLTEEDRQAYMEAWARAGRLTSGFNYYRANELGPDHPQDLTPVMIAPKTLVVWGESDPFLLTGNLTGLEEYVPKLTVRRIPEGNHSVMVEQPARVNAIIREFLEDDQ